MFNSLKQIYWSHGVRGLVSAAWERGAVDPASRLWNFRARGRKKTLWIHIGAHKTGTTFIQSALAQSRFRIRFQSVYFEPSGYDLGGTLTDGSPLPAASLEKIRSELRARLARRPESTIILSSEGFFGAPYRNYENIGLVARDLKAITADFDTRILAVVRRQDHFLESLYQQSIHEGSSATFAAFQETTDPHGFDWNRLLEGYAAAFGREQMKVVTYESLFRDPRRAADHLFAGLGSEFSCPSRSTGRSNPSVSKLGLEIARLVNPLLDRKQQKKLRFFLQREFCRSGDEDLQLFTDQERRELLQSYAESNRRLIETFPSISPADLLDAQDRPATAAV